jgi:hypothetical protein
MAKTNYRLKDGDKVRLLVTTEVGGYWYDSEHCPSGCWITHYILAGSVGTVTVARRPCVWSEDGRTEYFAKVDIPHVGGVSVIRVDHSKIRRLRK